MSDHSEERATMIAAGDLQEFIPRGREHCRRHPGAHNLQPRELQPASELCSSDGAAGLVGSLREVTIHERQRVGPGHSGAVGGSLYGGHHQESMAEEAVCHFLSPLVASLVPSPYKNTIFCSFSPF